MKLEWLMPEFITEIPEAIEPGRLYVSEQHRVAAHLCPCLCGAKIVTTFGKFGYSYSRSGSKVTLVPSIRNRCGSHYWITFNYVVWNS
jgi:hypothetical protein